MVKILKEALVFLGLLNLGPWAAQPHKFIIVSGITSPKEVCVTTDYILFVQNGHSNLHDSTNFI